MTSLDMVLGDRLNIAVLRWLAGIHTGISGNALARRLGQHQSSVRKALERLVAAGVVMRTDVGRSAAYTLNEDRAIVRRVLVPLFRREAELTETLLAAATALAARIVPPARAVILYGSLARGTRDVRDIDLCVLTSARADNERVRDALTKAAEPIARQFGLPVNPVVIAEPELTGGPARALLAEVRDSGVLLAGIPPSALAKVRRLPPRARGSARRRR